MNLIQKALLGMENEDLAITREHPVDTAGAPAQAPATPANTPETQTIVLDGPLSTAYTKALMQVYAKADPITGAPAQESQALDYYAAANAQANAPEAEAKPVEDTVNVVVTGTVLKADGEGEDAIPVVTELQSHGIPHDIVFVTGAMAPTDDSPVGGANHNLVEMGGNNRRPLALEDIEGYSIVVRLKNNKK